jgi:putative aminopeptidase FrvX
MKKRTRGQVGGGAAERRWLAFAAKLLACPTAVALEHSPADFVRAFARARPALRLTEDRYGNLVVKYPGRGTRKNPPLVLMGHLDHPGFLVERVEGGVADLAFRGGVYRKHAAPGLRVQFFRPGRARAIGSGRLTRVSSSGARRAGLLGSGTARVSRGRALAGGFAMWDLPAYALRGGRIHSRCLDDLLSCAATLAALDELCRRQPRGAHVWGLFTRAEEVGFFGALAAIKAGTVPRASRILSLETSRALPHAPQRGGVILRVGDARSLFDPALMGVVHDVAKELSSQDSGFRFQRRLMDGGSCEATPFCAAGYRAGGLALPLGNYHNMKGLDGGPKGIGAETVALTDYLSEVKLLVRLGELSGELPAREKAQASWLEPLTREAHALLAEAPLVARVAPRRRRARRSRR